MIGTFVSAAQHPASGAVHVLRAHADGGLWRRAIAPHCIAELDEAAPELSAEQRAAILADWAGRPAPLADEFDVSGAMT